MKTPLSRPDLPSVPEPIDWPCRVVAVFGRDALPFARELCAGVPGSVVVRVELRHAEGFDVQRDDEIGVHAHTDALLAALASLDVDAPITIGAGAPFAVAVRADHSVWITGGDTLLSLPAPLRPIARAAHLALEAPRPETARALAVRLRELTS